MEDNKTQGSKENIRDQKRKGIIFILLAALFFSLMSVFVRLSGDVPVFEKALFRNLVASVVSGIMLLRSGEKITIKKEDRMPLFLRCAFGTLGIVTNFWAISNIPMADATMLNKMSPAFAMLMSILILGEKTNAVDILCLIMAMLGAIFVVKPGTGMFSPGALVALLGGLSAGIAYTMVRKLGTNGVKGPVIVFCFSLFSTILCALLAIPNLEPITLWQFICLILAGSGAAAAQLSVTAAYTYAPAKEISVYDYFQVIFAAVWAFIVWRELPDGYSVVGYMLIIGTSVWRWWITMHHHS